MMGPLNLRPILKNHVNFPVCLAPMVGLSHVGLRMLVRRYLPANAKTFWPTEMLNSRRLPNEDFKTTPETYRSDTELDLVPQILGNEEEPIAQSVQKLTDWGAIGIDINMGCPVKKALKHNYGVALMGDADYAARVVDMTVRNSKVPVSVKLRAGIEDKPEELLKFVKKLESAGASWITLHPRLAHEKRRGTADWKKIALIRNELKIPIIGNGDIQVLQDIEDMFNIAECDMVMVGRALTARPWLLWQLGSKLGFENPEGLAGSAPNTHEEEGAEFAKAFLYFVEIMEEYFVPDLALRKIKFYLRTSSPWLEFGHILNAKISGCTTYDQMRGEIEHFFAIPQRMMAKTDLRI